MAWGARHLISTQAPSSSSTPRTRQRFFDAARLRRLALGTKQNGGGGGGGPLDGLQALRPLSRTSAQAPCTCRISVAVSHACSGLLVTSRPRAGKSRGQLLVSYRAARSKTNVPRCAARGKSIDSRSPINGARMITQRERCSARDTHRERLLEVSHDARPRRRFEHPAARRGVPAHRAVVQGKISHGESRITRLAHRGATRAHAGAGNRCAPSRTAAS